MEVVVDPARSGEDARDREPAAELVGGETVRRAKPNAARMYSSASASCNRIDQARVRHSGEKDAATPWGSRPGYTTIGADPATASASTLPKTTSGHRRPTASRRCGSSAATQMRERRDNAVNNVLHTEARLDCRSKTAGSAAKTKFETREQRQPGREDQLVEKARAPEAAEEQEGSGRGGDRGRRLERDVQRRSAIREVQPRNEHDCQTSRRQSRARNQRQASAGAARHLTFTHFEGQGPVFWAGPDCRFGYA